MIVDGRDRFSSSIATEKTNDFPVVLSRENQRWPRFSVKELGDKAGLNKSLHRKHCCAVNTISSEGNESLKSL